MLTLSLLRHAKSSWDNPTLPDQDRPLATRGVTDAPLMGKAMTHAMHILRAGVERVATGPGIVVGDAAARLHRDGGNSVVDQ